MTGGAPGEPAPVRTWIRSPSPPNPLADGWEPGAESAKSVGGVRARGELPQSAEGPGFPLRNYQKVLVVGVPVSVRLRDGGRSLKHLGPLARGVPLLLAAACVYPLASAWPQAEVGVASPSSVPSEPAPAFAAGSKGWFWILDGRFSDELVFQQRGQSRPRTLSHGRNWQELAVVGDVAWILQRDEDQGSLIRVNPDGTPAQTTVLEWLHRPAGLKSVGASLYWTEVREARSPLGFVPLAGEQLLIRRCEPDGRVRTLCTLPLDLTRSPEQAGIVVGEWGSDLVIVLRRSAGTECFRVDPTGKGAVRIAAEAGRRQAVILQHRLYWSAPSPEAGPGSGIECIRSLGPDGSKVLSDGLPANGRLLNAGSRLYWVREQVLQGVSSAGLADEALRLPSRGAVVSDGEQLFLLDGAEGLRSLPSGKQP